MKDNIKKDLLDNPMMKENPFSLPEGYLSSLEDRVHKRIFCEESAPSFWHSIAPATKSYAMLAFTFLIILGMGYGVLSLTNTLNKPSDSPSSYDLAVLIEEGYLNSSFIDDYYDEINFEEGAKKAESGLVLDDETVETIQERISEKDLMEYLGIDSPSDY